VPIVLYVAYFLTTRATFTYTCVTSAAFAATAWLEALEAATARVAFLALVIAVTAGGFRMLRDQVFGLIRALDRSARTDALTGVLNRLGLDERLADEVERAVRTDVECAVLMGDLDRFKTLNDRHGHHVGDAALTAVAQILSGRLRRLDAVGRFGGDEFVVLLPGTSRSAAEEVAHELAAAVRDSMMGRSRGLAVSFGVATCPADGVTTDAVPTAADRRLLDLKRRAASRAKSAVT